MCRSPRADRMQMPLRLEGGAGDCSGCCEMFLKVNKMSTWALPFLHGGRLPFRSRA